MSSRSQVVVLALIAITPGLAQETRLDLSGTWRVSPRDAKAGTVSFSRSGDRWTMRFHKPGAAARELAVSFDGTTLRTAPAPATLPAGAGRSPGFGRVLEGGSDDPAGGARPAVEPRPEEGRWTLGRIAGSRTRPALNRFEGKGPEGFPTTFARQALELAIDGGEGGRLGVGTEAAFEGVLQPPVAGTYAWSATPADALELQADGKWLVAKGKRGGKVTLQLAFTSSALGDVVETTRVVEVRPGVERIEVAAITYRTDHGLLRDNASDWGAKGAALGEPEWTAARQAPISHTMGQKVGIRLELNLGPANAVPGGKVFLFGDGPGDVDFAGELELKPGKVVLELVSQGALEKKVQALDLALAWSIVGSATPLQVVPEKTATTAYVTFDTPVEAGDGVERGITVKRMAKAVESVGGANTLDPHEIVRAVISKWDHFNLDVAYRNAWDLGQELKDPVTGKLVGADCQTIVRYTRVLIKQAGVPGQPDFVVVWAKCTDPKTGIESLERANHMGKPRQMHNASFKADPARANWAAYLIDGNGRPNNYEAALRFTHDGKKKYYPGGVNSVLDDATQVVGVFTTMSWLDLTTGKVQDAIHRYR